MHFIKMVFLINAKSSRKPLKKPQNNSCLLMNNFLMDVVEMDSAATKSNRLYHARISKNENGKMRKVEILAVGNISSRMYLQNI